MIEEYSRMGYVNLKADDDRPERKSQGPTHESTTQARCNAPDHSSAPLSRWPTGISTALRVDRILSISVAIFHTMPRPMTAIQFVYLLQMQADPQNVTSCFPMKSRASADATHWTFAVISSPPRTIWYSALW